MASKRDKAADWHRNGLNLATDPRRLAELLAELRSRSVPTLRDRWNRVRYNLVLALQAGLAAGLSWVIVTSWLKNPDPVFAPIAAVGTLAASVGQRFRRTVELIIGVTVGIAIGEVFILLFGIGGGSSPGSSPWP
ncbi:FUSC family protein [Micromonospora zhanjiangensis]